MLNLHPACLMITLHIKCSIFHLHSSIELRINGSSDFSQFHFLLPRFGDCSQKSVKHMRNVIHLHTLLASFEVASVLLQWSKEPWASTSLKNLVKL